jgi:hypothetical protein
MIFPRRSNEYFSNLSSWSVPGLGFGARCSSSKVLLGHTDGNSSDIPACE